MFNKILTSYSYPFASSSFKAASCLQPFELKIRQQPIQARINTTNDRDRRPLDPPPIVQILFHHPDNQINQSCLQDPYLIMAVTLVDSDRRELPNHSVPLALLGQTASSMYRLKDINNQDGGFFVFGDISVRLEGYFRLKLSLFQISTHGAVNLKSIYSNVFQVYSVKTFPGMLESTFLSRSFSDQGVRIRIRKEHRIQLHHSNKRKLSREEEQQQQAKRVLPLFSPIHQTISTKHLSYRPSPFCQVDQCQRCLHSTTPTPIIQSHYTTRPVLLLPTPSYHSSIKKEQEKIHLPPIQSLMTQHGEVDAAVAMMQLALKRNQPQ